MELADLHRTQYRAYGGHVKYIIRAAKSFFQTSKFALVTANHINLFFMRCKIMLKAS